MLAKYEWSGAYTYNSKCTWRLCRLLTATRLTRSSVVGRPRGPRRPCSLEEEEEEEEGSVSAPANAWEMPLGYGWVDACVCCMKERSQ